MGRTKQVLKFVLVFIVLLAAAWWIEAYDIRPYEQPEKPYGTLREITWIILTFLMTFGFIHVIAFGIVANRKLFETLKLPSILTLTAISSGIFTAHIIDWKLPDRFDSPESMWIIYYPSISMGAVLVRYFWFRYKDRRGMTKAGAGSVMPR